MRIHPDCQPFITGEEFSASLSVSFEYDDADFKHLTRHEILQGIAAGKRLIHVGCVDHSIQQINVKLKHNRWVHKLVCDVASRCVGVDVLCDCVNYIRDTLGFEETYCGDILTDDFPFLHEQEWDYVFLPEVLEHINDPGVLPKN